MTRTSQAPMPVEVTNRVEPIQQPQVMSADPRAASDVDVIDLGKIWATIWRGKWITLLFALLMGTAGAYYAINVATNVYSAKTVLILETQQAQIVDLQSVSASLSSDFASINSQVEVLKSREMLGQIVDNLNLTEEPEFNPSLNEITPFRQMTKDTRKRVLSLLRNEPEGTQNTNRVSPNAEQEKRAFVRNRAIDRLNKRLTVENLPATYVLEIAVETGKARLSTKIADELALTYVQNQLDAQFESTEQAVSWLTGRVSDLQVQLEEAESRVSQFNSSTDLISVEALQAQEIQLKSIRDRIEETQESRTAMTARLERLQAATDPQVQAELAQDLRLQQLLETLSQPEVAARFATLYRSIVTRLEIEILRSTQQIAALEESAKRQERQIQKESEDLIELQQLTREADAIRLLYEYFLTRLNETTAQEGIQRQDSRILSYAVVPRSPIAPDRPLIVLIATFLGAVLGISLVMFLDGRKKGFRTARELESFSNHVVLGQIPQIARRRRKKVLEYLHDSPTSVAAEAVRNLRTSVMLSAAKPPQVIMSTSSLPGEGKTTNALALAQNIVGLGKSVLLVEGDIRRQVFRQYFDKAPRDGLTTVLYGDKPLEEAVFRDKMVGADILVGDNTEKNAADVFASKEFESFLRDARAKYDTIIIDTPPVLIVPDARIIAQHADAILITVRWDHTTRMQVEEMLHMFQTAGLSITGLVLGQINSRRMKSYGYGSAYGAYAQYGSKYYNTK